MGPTETKVLVFSDSQNSTTDIRTDRSTIVQTGYLSLTLSLCPCNMSLTKANISKIKPLPGPTGTNFEKHKRNCIATLFGLVFSFEFV